MGVLPAGIKLWDCFLFNDELDLLDIRLHHLSDYVDHFVLVESTHTFQGRQKPLYYAQNIQRFRDFASRIVHVVIAGFPRTQVDGDYCVHPWTNEFYSREAMRGALRQCRAAAHDLVMLSDCDEIPDLRYWNGKPGIFSQWMSFYYLNLREEYLTSQTIVFPYEWIQKGTGMEEIRNNRHTFFRDPKQNVTPGGWHFTWCGDPDWIMSKIQSYSHWELGRQVTLEGVQQAYQELRDFVPTRDKFKFNKISIDGYLPPYVQENPERFKHLICP